MTRVQRTPTSPLTRFLIGNILAHLLHHPLSVIRICLLLTIFSITFNSLVNVFSKQGHSPIQSTYNPLVQKSTLTPQYHLVFAPCSDFTNHLNNVTFFFLAQILSKSTCYIWLSYLIIYFGLEQFSPFFVFGIHYGLRGIFHSLGSPSTWVHLMFPHHSGRAFLLGILQKRC